MNNFPINDQPSKGPLLGTIIIVLIIIIGGIYIITSRGNNEVTPPPSTESTGIAPTEDQSQTALAGLGAVQADLDASEDDLVTLEGELK